MSHITKISTTIINFEIVEAALQFLDIKNVIKDAEVRMWNSNFKAPLVIRQKSYDVGFVMENGYVLAKADSFAWNELFSNPKVKACAVKKNPNENTFADILKQACNVVTAISVANANGHT
jgi:hypothetical protein